jgi:hypothetical protein
VLHCCTGSALCQPQLSCTCSRELAVVMDGPCCLSALSVAATAGACTRRAQPAPVPHHVAASACSCVHLGMACSAVAQHHCNKAQALTFLPFLYLARITARKLPACPHAQGAPTSPRPSARASCPGQVTSRTPPRPSCFLELCIFLPISTSSLETAPGHRHLRACDSRDSRPARSLAQAPFRPSTAQ